MRLSVLFTSCRIGSGAVKMERISQALQLPVVVERGRPISSEFELLEKLDFLRGRIARQRWILQEGLEPRLFVDGWDGFAFHELKFFRVPGRQAAVQDDLHRERREVDVPRFDQRIQKRDAILRRNVEDICFQELKHHDPHLLVASVAESSDETKPVFIVQLLFRQSLGNVQQLLGDEAFQGRRRAPSQTSHGWAARFRKRTCEESTPVLA